MKTILRALAILSALALLLFVPDGKILSDVQNAYYIGEPPAYAAAVCPYGAVLALGAALALLAHALLYVRGEKKSLRALLPEITAFSARALWLSVVLSRLIYCLVNWSFYEGPAGFAGALRWWEGGMSMTGVLLGALGAAYWTYQGKDQGYEAAALALPLMIFLARCAEHFAAIGVGLDVEFGGIFAVEGEFGSTLNISLIEALSILLIAAAMLLWKNKDRLCPRGPRYLMAMVIFYGAVQILMESLRWDRHMIWGFVKAQQLFSFLLALGCLMALAWRCGRRVAVLCASAALAGAVFGLEKALDRLDIPSIYIYLVFIALIAAYVGFAFAVARRNEKRLRQ